MRLTLAAASVLVLAVIVGVVYYMMPHRVGKGSVEERLHQYGAAARSNLAPHFSSAGVVYPPRRIVLAALKAERRLELYAAGVDGKLHHVRSYDIRGASGTSGPKLREGDRQVPEGIYRIESLNPNSRFHLSLRVDYPNADDRARAAAEGRSQLGGDIMIHGGSASVGCLAMGDEAAEELFVLAADVSLPNIKVVLAPCDLRVQDPRIPSGSPAWLPALYEQVRSELAALPIARR